MKFKKVIVFNSKRKEIQTFKNATHDCWQGSHVIDSNENTYWFPMSCIVYCLEPYKEALAPKTKTIDLPMAPGPSADDLAGIPVIETGVHSVSELLDAGNELMRLVIETRDSIRDSGVLQTTQEFPDTEDGIASKEWFDEYDNAAKAWLNAQGGTQ